MKRIALFVMIILGTHFVYSQKGVQHDPSYSVHNYKHPNKAAYAKKHKLDKNVVIETEPVKGNEDYKHRFNKPEKTNKSVIRVKTGRDKSNKSYKHPHGL